MKVLLDSLTTTVIGGLLVVVPVALLALILDDVVTMVMALVAPVVDMLMFVPAVLSLPEDSLQLVYVIEDHGNGFATVMIPSVPAALAGPLQYVRSQRLRKLDVPLGVVVQSLQTCGVGAGPLFAPDSNAPS